MDTEDHSTSANPPLLRPVAPRLDWDDLVFDDNVSTQLREIEARWRDRDAVLNHWGMRRRLKSDGLLALFTGEPGTGKTEAASVIAAQLGLTLCQVSTAALLSKYIGETEKNIEQVLSIAEAKANIALVFDEAEALFAKRVDARGSVEIAHSSQISLLLSRLERFSGLVFLTTNHTALIDTAFKRRFHVFVEFRMPGPELRAQIFRLALAEAPVADDLDDRLFDDGEYSGGSIQNVVLNAAFLARRRGGSMITNDDLQEALSREAHKMGRLVQSR
ncbi:MAG: ATP-binding protein [Rhodospirillales bacterium]|nr:ATP-binding protein [Rhodospirillales bacterium]